MTYVDAIYWTVMTLTTVGYGDMTALSPQGRALEMVRACVRVSVTVAWLSSHGRALTVVWGWGVLVGSWGWVWKSWEWVGKRGCGREGVE